MTPVPENNLQGKGSFDSLLRLSFLLLVIGIPFLSLLVDEKAQPALLPLMAIVEIFIIYLLTNTRVSEINIFTYPFLCVISTFIYSVIPLLGFILSDYKITSHSDNRLCILMPTAIQIGDFSWRYVVYFGALALGSSIISLEKQEKPLEKIGSPIFIRALTIGLIIFCYLQLIHIIYGASYDESYDSVKQGNAPSFKKMPYALQQVSHNIFGIYNILKQFILIYCMTKWADFRWRCITLIWLGGEVVSTVLLLGARVNCVLLLLTAALLYHRFVKPFSTVRLAIFGSGFLILFLAYGAVRDLDEGVSYASDRWSMRNEFQSMFATSYDIYVMRDSIHVPWYIYCCDLIRLVPSQLLPFDKIDPSQWYLKEIGLQDTGVGFMFGVISQGVVGLDWIELAVRGFALGIFGSILHNWYIRRSNSPGALLAYVYLCVWSYYTFRDTTFTQVYYVVYRLFPVLLLLGYVSFNPSESEKRVRG